MAPNEFTERLQEVGAPERRFWESELEIGYDHALRPAMDEGFMNEWLDRRSGRQINMLTRGMGQRSPGSVRAQKGRLRNSNGDLLPYLLVQEFSKFKSKPATFEFASTVLPPDIIEACRKDEDDFDALALCFAIYQQDPSLLPNVLHLDKIYRSGFARMVMKAGPRRPSRQFGEFLARETVEALLDEFDESKGDGRTGELKTSSSKTITARIHSAL